MTEPEGNPANRSSTILKIVVTAALVRLSPLFPFTVVNDLFGLTPVHPLPYVLASWVTMLPGTAANVDIGSALGDGASRGRTSPTSSPFRRS